MLGAILQRRISEQLRQAFDAEAWGEQPAHLDAAFENLRKPFRFFSAMGLERLWLLRSLPELVDPLLDAANAGMATWSIAPSSKALFRASWRSVPLLGAGVGWLGLPATLLMLLLFASAYQLTQLWHYSSQALNLLEAWPQADDASEPAENARFTCFLMMGHAADSGNVMLLGDVLHHLASACGEEYTRRGFHDNYCYADRSIKFKGKVLFEALPAMWFQVSLLALTLQSASASRLAVATACLSLFTSLATSLIGLQDFSWAR